MIEIHLHGQKPVRVESLATAAQVMVAGTSATNGNEQTLKSLMPEPVTTYVLTFKSRVVDDSERRANLNRFLKAAKRSYQLECVNIETRTTAKRVSKAKPKTTERPYNELIQSVNRRLDGRT